MFRNQYDNDVTVWSPLGRLHQVEYAMEAVKLGSATVGVKNETHAVLVALKRATSELSAHQKKVIVISDHLGISLSGLTADARLLSRFMRNECLYHEYINGTELPLSRLINRVTNKMQMSTQRYDRRPYGVGLLVAGYDDEGPHIFQLCPSANANACRAMAIGSRSQSARTYLEKHLDTINSCSTEDLILHALRALRDTLPNDVDLNGKNVAIAVVGKGTVFKEFNEDETRAQLEKIAGEERRSGSSHAGMSGTTSSAPPKDEGGDEGEPDPIPSVAMESQ